MRELSKEVRQKVCLLLGSRDAESTIRAANIAKQRGSSDRVIKTKDGAELYVVKNWLASDVWEFLLSAGMGSKYPLPSYLAEQCHYGRALQGGNKRVRVVGNREKGHPDHIGRGFSTYRLHVGLPSFQ